MPGSETACNEFVLCTDNKSFALLEYLEGAGAKSHMRKGAEMFLKVLSNENRGGSRMVSNDPFLQTSCPDRLG
jgi:hypothetical protein